MKNRKIQLFILVAAFLLPGAGAFAQAQVSLGLKGGLNFANLDVTNLEGTYHNRTGYHLGAFALFKFAKIGIQPELVYSQQGSKVHDPNLGDFESNFSYVNVPVLLKLYTVGGLNLQVGPQFGFLTSAKKDGENIEDQLRNSDTSLALGVGWDLPLRLSVDVRYNLGLKNISDEAVYDIKNQVWQVSLGFKLIKIGN